MASRYGAPSQPPMNAPPAGAPPVGVQPGTSGIVIASLVVVIGPAGSQIVIGPNVPDVVINFYNAHGQTVNKMWIGMYFDAANYSYSVVGTLSAGTQQFRGEGWVRSGVLFERECQFFDAVNSMVDATHGSNGIASEESWYGGFIRLRNHISTGVLTDLTFQNPAGTDVSAPRGLVYFEQITGNKATTTALTEQVLWTTTNTMTFRDGRAFKVDFSGLKKTAAVQSPGTNFRQTNIAGAILYGARLDIPLTGVDIGFHHVGIFRNTSGANVTSKICLTAQPQVATIVNIDAGASGQYWWVEDIGAAADFAGQPSVV